MELCWKFVNGSMIHLLRHSRTSFELPSSLTCCWRWLDQADNPKRSQGYHSADHTFSKPETQRCWGRKLVKQKDAKVIYKQLLNPVLIFSQGNWYEACLSMQQYKAVVCSGDECGVEKQCLLQFPMKNSRRRMHAKPGSFCKKGDCNSKSQSWWTAPMCSGAWDQNDQW